MQSSSKAEIQTTADTAFAILHLMQRMGVAGLPRNYEIFYEAHAGSNAALRTALEALGPRPEQDDLDRLSLDFFAQSAQTVAVDNAHDAIMAKIEEIMVLLHRERSSLEKYGIILDQTSAGLASKQQVTAELLKKIVDIMSMATDTTIAQGRQIANSIADTSAELADVKEKLGEYKKLADTDSLTQIWNRRAFDKQMARIYSDRKSVLFSALIIADIDRFKDINDRHGHPLGDKVLQHIARVFKASGTPDMFIARTGGEEFAMIVEGLSEDSTVQLAEDMRAIIERTPFIHANAAVAGHDRITVSMGVCMATEANGPDDLYEKADEALYASKMHGRNRVTKYPVPGPKLQRKNWMLYRTD
jgi:diguanylate cyclase